MPDSIPATAHIASSRSASRLRFGEGSLMLRHADVAAIQATLKNGKRPDSPPIAAMPFAALAQLDDNVALAWFALFAHLNGLR
jgi:hypothetical protein